MLHSRPCAAIALFQAQKNAKAARGWWEILGNKHAAASVNMQQREERKESHMLCSSLPMPHGRSVSP